MASVQVLPNSAASSRREHLEAGKRRLEEFRKKKAEGRAKKPTPTEQQQSNDLGQHYRQPQDSEYPRLIDSDGAVKSERDGIFSTALSGFITAGDAQADHGSSNGTHNEPLVSAKNDDFFSAHRVQEPFKDQDSKHSNDSSLSRSVYGYYDQHQEDNSELDAYSGNHRGQAFGFTTESSSALHLGHDIQNINRSTLQSSYYSTDSIHSRTNSIKSATEVKQYMNDNVSPYSTLPEARSSNGLRVENAPWQSKSFSTDYGLDTRGSSGHVSHDSALPEAGSRRSRPSFLDSLNVARVSSVSHIPIPESGKAVPFSPKSSRVHSVDGDSGLPSFTSPHKFTGSMTLGPILKSGTLNLHEGYELSLVNYPVPSSNEGESLRQNAEEDSVRKKLEFISVKHNEDFTALEQHIEDLTQEKFSLLRALDASGTLAGSLTTENSSLTERYNQQGAIVDQLKSDLESLRVEIRMQLLELESVKRDYTSAQLECNAADERAKILASEVIGLEEEALRLRSNELKLEKQLENSNAEITSYKKKMSCLEKECQDLQSTIDALQEEKKLLQSMLRKASTIGKPVDGSKMLTTTKDVSTSTKDIDDSIYASVTGENSEPDTSSSNLGMQDAISIPLSQTSTSLSVPESSQFRSSAVSAAIPPDQLRMIDNINSLVSELTLEKEELVQALAVESSHSSKLKGLNAELSRKLEVQTQRLELLTTQSMATENIPTRQSDPRAIMDNMVYADEGDEVVERVLSWMMKLFPGGPKRRRTSKLL